MAIREGMNSPDSRGGLTLIREIANRADNIAFPEDQLGVDALGELVPLLRKRDGLNSADFSTALLDPRFGIWGKGGPHMPPAAANGASSR